MTDAGYILTTSTPDTTGIVAAVTADLDEGPIIEQEVHRVDHTLEPEGLTAIGHDIESITLNRAVRWHAEHRVFVHGNRTVVLR